MENIKPDSNVLVEIVQTKMPFGKYKGTLVSDIPVSYLEWMHSKGFPPGKLGMMLATVYEIKTNGLTEILFKVKRVVAKEGDAMAAGDLLVEIEPAPLPVVG